MHIYPENRGFIHKKRGFETKKLGAGIQRPKSDRTDETYYQLRAEKIRSSARNRLMKLMYRLSAPPMA